MANPYVFEFSSLTGGVDGALDSFNTTSLTDASHAKVDTGSIVYTYVFGSGSSATENSPFIVAPDTGTGRWLLSGAISKYDTKQNLLVNSGLGVCSNSTLENVPGTSNLITSWTNATYETFTSSGANITSAINTTGNGQASFTFADDLAEGKLYRAVITLTLTSGTAPQFNINGTGTTLVAGVNTIVFTALASQSTTYFWTTNGVATNFSATCTLYEVTPGFVAANSYGPDGWIKTTSADIYREHSGDNTKDGSFYALKFTKGADSNESLIWPVASLHSTPAHYMKFRGRTVCIGMWVKTSVANNIKVGFYDGAWHLSDYHTGGGEWEWLEYSYTPATDITRFNAGLYANGSTADESYHTQPVVMFGSSIGEGNYSQPQGEIVWCDATDIDLTDYNNDTISADVDIDIEAQSKGIIPKGFKALNMFLQGECAASEKTLSLGWQDLKLYSQVANGMISGNGMVRDKDNDGTISLKRDATFTLVEINITGVQVS